MFIRIRSGGFLLGGASIGGGGGGGDNNPRRRAVIDLVDNTVAPPTEVDGDRYILDNTGGGVNAGWDGASINDVVQFNGASGLWEATTPEEGWITYVDLQDKDARFIDDGTPMWELIPAAITVHNDMSGKQGGGEGEFYHLTSNQEAAAESAVPIATAVNPFVTSQDPRLIFSGLIGTFGAGGEFATGKLAVAAGRKIFICVGNATEVADTVLPAFNHKFTVLSSAIWSLGDFQLQQSADDIVTTLDVEGEISWNRTTSTSPVTANGFTGGTVHIKNVGALRNSSALDSTHFVDGMTVKIEDDITVYAADVNGGGIQLNSENSYINGITLVGGAITNQKSLELLLGSHVQNVKYEGTHSNANEVLVTGTSWSGTAESISFNVGASASFISIGGTFKKLRRIGPGAVNVKYISNGTVVEDLNVGVTTYNINSRAFCKTRNVVTSNGSTISGNGSDNTFENTQFFGSVVIGGSRSNFSQCIFEGAVTVNGSSQNYTDVRFKSGTATTVNPFAANVSFTKCRVAIAIVDNSTGSTAVQTDTMPL